LGKTKIADLEKKERSRKTDWIHPATSEHLVRWHWKVYVSSNVFVLFTKRSKGAHLSLTRASQIMNKGSKSCDVTNLRAVTPSKHLQLFILPHRWQILKTSYQNAVLPTPRQNHGCFSEIGLCKPATLVRQLIAITKKFASPIKKLSARRNFHRTKSYSKLESVEIYRFSVDIH